MVSAHTASQEELKAAKVPVAWRDQCSAYVSLCVWAGSVPTDHRPLADDQVADTIERVPEKELLSSLGVRE